MEVEHAGECRRLYHRGSSARGLIVDVDGVAMGPDCPLVERRGDVYRVIGLLSAGQLLKSVFGYEDDPQPFMSLCHSIAQALASNNLVRAQLLALQSHGLSPAASFGPAPKFCTMSAGAYIGNCCRFLPDGAKIQRRVGK